jgi:flagellar basal-body rod modification protein FlgD
VDLLGDMAGLVGLDARVTGQVVFDGSPVRLSPEFPEGTSSGSLIVRDASGAEVQRLLLTRADGDVDWAGTTADGRPLPAGAYSFALETDPSQSPVEVAAYATVTEARRENGTTWLVLSGGRKVAASDASGLRQP